MNGDWTLQATYAPIALPKAGEHDYGFTSASGTSVEGGSVEAGTFVHLVSGASAAPFRAYLKYTGSDVNWAKARTRSESQELPQRIIVRIADSKDATAIGTLDTRTGEITTDAAWFTLSGHRLSPPSLRQRASISIRAERL